jgi:hypothetical protein
MSGEHERHDSTERQAAVRAAGGLTEALTAMTEQLAAVDKGSQQRDASLKTYGRRNRLFIVADVVMTVVATVAVGISVHASSQASHAAASAAAAAAATSAVHASNISACQAGNVTRAQQAQLWAYVISLVKPPPDATPLERRQARRVKGGLQAHVRNSTSPRNCAALYRLH